MSVEIDWFTVGAQLLNFAVLFWLLSRFLYRPIVDAVDEREARIAARLEEAERRQQEADKQQRHYEELEEELEQQRDERLGEARRQAEEKKRELMEQLREEVETARERWYGRLQAEQRRFVDEFARRLEDQVFGVARDALAELADVEVAEKIVDRFVDKLEGDAVEVAEAVRAEVESDGQIRVRSSFPLEDAQRDRITARLTEGLERDVDVEFAVDEQLVAGIEVRAGAERFGWNIRAYLESLRATMRDELRAATGPEEAALDE